MILYCKCIQLLYKTIKSINIQVLIIKYKGDPKEITEQNKSRVAVKSKDTLLNYLEVILNLGHILVLKFTQVGLDFPFRSGSQLRLYRVSRTHAGGVSHKFGKILY